MKTKELTAKSSPQVAPQEQFALDLGIEVERRVSGIEMGVLENGIPYLTQKGLATTVGVARNTIFQITREWKESFDDPIQKGTRIGFLKDYLFRNEYDSRDLYIEIEKDNAPHYAYSDIVCMAVLEFMAFESKRPNSTALRHYRRLAPIRVSEIHL